MPMSFFGSQETPAPVPPERRLIPLMLVALLCAVMCVLAISAMRRESVTVDEPLNLTAGYTFWKFGDYRLDDTNGVLPQRWFALPLLLMPVTFPARDGDTWHRPGYIGRDVCTAFLFDSGNDAGRMVFMGRIMALCFALACVLAVYGWTALLFGTAPGLLAAFFCALCPTMLAHGHLMTLDCPAAFFFLMATGCFWLLLRRLTPWRLAASVVFVGFLMVTKMSALLIVPIAGVMLVVKLSSRTPWPIRGFGGMGGTLSGSRGRWAAVLGITLAHAIGAWAIIWLFYGFRFQPAGDWNAARDAYTEPFAAVLGSFGRLQSVFGWLREARILPEAYIYGFAHTVKHVAERHAFLNGQYSTSGWWYYFPYCFLVKTSIPVLAGCAAACGFVLWKLLRRGVPDRETLLERLDRTSPIWALALVYGLASLFTPLNIGYRHILPIYLPAFAAAGAGVWALARRSRWGLLILGILAAGQVATVAGIHPDYISYFNPLAGGSREGYRHLTDSNVDWGQDLPALSAWLRNDPAVARGGRVYVNCFAYDSPDRWGIRAYRLPYDVSNRRLSAADPVCFEPGTYCISATALMIPGPPWGAERERAYVAALAGFSQIEQAGRDGPDDDARRRWRDFIFKLASVQYLRLRAYLALRDPDEMVGHSILVFRISDEELHRALLPN